MDKDHGFLDSIVNGFISDKEMEDYEIFEKKSPQEQLNELYELMIEDDKLNKEEARKEFEKISEAYLNVKKE